MSIKLNEFAKDAYNNAVEHGFYENEIDSSFPVKVALMHSELSEALEEYRAGRPMEWKACTEAPTGKTKICCPKNIDDCLNFGAEDICKHRSEKPEGVAVELIDCMIRILEYLGSKDVDIERILKEKHEYNKKRPYKHNKKF